MRWSSPAHGGSGCWGYLSTKEIRINTLSGDPPMLNSSLLPSLPLRGSSCPFLQRGHCWPWEAGQKAMGFVLCHHSHTLQTIIPGHPLCSSTCSSIFFWIVSSRQGLPCPRPLPLSDISFLGNPFFNAPLLSGAPVPHFPQSNNSTCRMITHGQPPSWKFCIMSIY